MVTGPSVSDLDIFVAVQSFLQSILPSGTEVVQGLENRVSEPSVDDFVVMIPMFRERLGTDLVAYDSPEAGSAGTAAILMATQVTVQLDVHGPNSGNNAQLIATLWRSDYGVQQVRSQGYDIAPLYTADPRQIPFLNGEQQFEVRWIVDVIMQANPVITLPQDFATELALGLNPTASPPIRVGVTPGLIDIDAAFPPSSGSVGIITLRTTLAGLSF